MWSDASEGEMSDIVAITVECRGPSLHSSSMLLSKRPCYFPPSYKQIPPHPHRHPTALNTIQSPILSFNSSSSSSSHVASLRNPMPPPRHSLSTTPSHRPLYPSTLPRYPHPPPHEAMRSSKPHVCVLIRAPLFHNSRCRHRPGPG